MVTILHPGDIVERYRVELQLGRGGMALVYRVRHVTLGTVHALKVLQVDDPAVRERLISEGRVQARFRHDNVVNVTDVLELDGTPALLMDFVGGGSLAERLQSGPLPRDLALQLFEGIVHGVAHAHEHGMVHRDLKPANVLLDQKGTALLPKVTDFGLARLTDETMHREHHTRTGQAMGTPAYMAPEQIRDASTADQRADIYSLGVMLYELLCGARPFSAPDVLSLMFKVATGAYQPPEVLVPDLPPPLRQAITGAMARDREHRIPDCETLLAVVRGELPWSAPSQPGATTAAPLPDLPGGDPSQTWDPDAAHQPAPVTAPASHTFVLDGPSAPLAATIPATDTGPAPSPTTRATLAPPSPGGEESTAEGSACSVAALVVDEAGVGHVVEVVVALIPGGSGVWAPDGVGRDARVAAQLAIAVALGPEASHYGIRWGVRGSSAELYGTSIGLAVAMAARAAWLGVELPEGWAYTGGIDLDGRVASVGGLPAKARAAVAQGLSHVAAPAIDVERAPGIDGVELVGVARFDQAVARLLPAAPSRRRWGRLPSLLLVPVLVFMGALALPEAWLHHGLLSVVRGPLSLDNTAILGVDLPDARALRPQHADTLRALADAGARAVLIDMAFGRSEPEVDQLIADAITEVEARGMPVVMALRFSSEGPQLPGTPALAEAARPGSVEAARAGPFGHIVGVRVRRRDLHDGSPLWHTAVLAAALVQGSDSPRIEDDRLVVGVTSNPLTDEILALPPFQNDPLVVRYSEQERFDELRGRVVIIGAWDVPLDHHPTAGGRRYGAELQAAAVETVLRQAAPRRLSPEWNALSALLAGAGVLGLGLLLPRRLHPLALLVPASLVAIGAALAASGVLLGLLGIVLGAAVGWWTLRGVAPPR